MSPAEMKAACDTVIASYKSMDLPIEKAQITLVTPKGFKNPPKFPRGCLLQVKEDGRRIWHFNAIRILAWIKSVGAA